jgi:hypothetical protein
MGKKPLRRRLLQRKMPQAQAVFAALLEDADLGREGAF